VAVLLLLALIWAVVLVPPAVRASAARKEAFLVSFGEVPVTAPPARARSRPVQRRRRIAGGLLAAMATTLVVGLLPTFRVFLVVHLFLVDSFLAYIALLAHAANQAARVTAVAPAVTVRRRAALRRRPRLALG
jgi:hypothetical protein